MLIQLGQSALGELKPISIDQSSLKALSLDNEEDRKFLEEVQLLHAIAKKKLLNIVDGKPDVYWLVISGVRPVFDKHGSNSEAAKEALILLNEAIASISEAFRELYKDEVTIFLFMSKN